MRKYLGMVAVVVSWLAWKETASLSMCMLFWVTVLVYGVNIIMKYPSMGRLLILLGVTCNAVVTLANDGVMPAMGMPRGFHPADPIWQAHGKHLTFLADQWYWNFFSVGDMLMLVGSLLVVVQIIYDKGEANV